MTFIVISVCHLPIVTDGRANLTLTPSNPIRDQIVSERTIKYTPTRLD